MVTKHGTRAYKAVYSLILAKIYMVTKQEGVGDMFLDCLILAKIYMVTKHIDDDGCECLSLILAKIYMVTKLLLSLVIL